MAAALVTLVVVGCRQLPDASRPGSTASAISPPSMSPITTSPAVAPTSPMDPASSFHQMFGQRPPPYRLVLEVAIAGASSGTARIDADVNGADYRADVLVELGDLPPRPSQIVYVDGTAYLREPSDDVWIIVPRYRSTPPLNPFLFLDPTELRDEGADGQRDGLRRLSSSAWVEPDASLGYREGGVDNVRFHVWLDAAGAPVEASLVFDLVGIDPGGEAVELAYEARYTFTDVGATITIEPPVAMPSASP